MAKDKATEKKKRPPDRMMMFAAEYIIDWNGTRAYQKVYGEKMDYMVAAAAASRLLKNVKVCSEIERLLNSAGNRRAERRARVIDALEEIAFDDLEVDTYTDKDGNLIGVSRKDRVKALELLGKTEALFTDVVKTDGEIDIRLKFDPKGV